ncbi:family 78 glycoside hydrolase catalytic domain [Aridibaculum aurantiacum]|uniref:family 78 glycoside hydrolase catalytic domain n=1 Tax=Aridibaculum aurantiacum TaxID=2810307 RepID=UPI001A963E82|nr:family 78 glycoside hydrolase catalytic domain [Aridibaculum aurantiacum]
MLKIIFNIVFLFVCLAGFAQGVDVINLRTEYKVNPMGVEAAAPGLSWQLSSNQRSVLQTAYRILVADDSAVLKKNQGNIWDSKKIQSGTSVQVSYAGKKLAPAKTYYWKVMLWDNKNNVSRWSDVARWQTGLMTTNDWKGAKWIAYDKIADSNISILPVDGKKDKYLGNNVLPLLRKNFTVKKPVKQATMFITGLGHFEMSVNGKKVGDHFLDAGWTKYDKQALYVPFDLTNQLKQGSNAIGIMLGNGFYFIPPLKGRYRKTKNAFGHPKMIARLAIEYADGTKEDIVSDASWKTTASPITFSSIYGGEDYDANLEQKGWDTPSFTDKGWRNVLIVDGPSVLNAQMAEPLKVMETFAPKNVTQLASDRYVFDLGQNASGIPSIKVQGKKGDTVRVYPAELLRADGSVAQGPTGSQYYLQYVLKGDGVETWQPRFTYYGFRYLQVNGAVPKGAADEKGLPVLQEIKGLHIRNAAQGAGEFTSSKELFNKTHELIDWAIKSNMVSVFTDCPHREKLGWLEQVHLMGYSVQHNYDIAQLGRKTVEDMLYSQTAEGLIPEIAPEFVKFEWGGDMFRDSPEWGSSGIIFPWYLYQWYGDKQVLLKSYPMMKRYIDYLGTKAQGHILKQGLGDWYDLGPKAPGVSQLTPMGVTGTAIYYYDLNILSKIARLIGKTEDASTFDQLALQVKQAFNDSFFNKETKQYATGSQAANAMAVYMQLVEPQYKGAVIENIVKDIRSRNNSLTAGDIGYRYLLRVLQEAGRSDVIYDMNSRTDVPGYGYQLAKGATALTESWAALPTNSNNHFMLGHLMEWFYRGLAGINQADGSVAYKDIVINPEVVGDVTSVNGSYHSVHGKIVSEWKKDGNSFTHYVVIPANTTATVYLPATAKDMISEGGVAVKNSKDVRLVGYENGKAILKLGSGEYSLKVERL